MPRFDSNRTWTLIPALWLSLALVPVAATDLAAQTRDFEDGFPGDSGGSPAPPHAGDPDDPGATKRAGGPGRGTTGRWRAIRPAGDRSEVRSDWTWSLRLVVRNGWKIYFLR